MSGLSRNMVMKLDCLDEVRPLVKVPRGDLLNVGMNPFNGNVVISVQDNPEARFYTRLIIDQLAEYVDMFELPADYRNDGAVVPDRKPSHEMPDNVKPFRFTRKRMAGVCDED